MAMGLFEKVSDDLLISILLLTGYKTICRCRAVCKSWNYALTDSKIRGAFAPHALQDDDNFRPKVTFLIEKRTIVPSQYDMYYEWEFYQSHYVRPQFFELSYYRSNARLTQTPPSFLEFLSQPSVRVRASHLDVLLVSSSPVNYYLYNYKSGESVSLPQAPNAGVTPAGYGLVSKNNTVRAVLFHTACQTAEGSEYRYMVSVFASETRSWTRGLSPAWPITAEEDVAGYNFSKEKGGTEGVVVYMEALFWLNVWEDHVTSIVRFDPYAETSSHKWGLCNYLPRWILPPLYTDRKKFIGKCWGQLRYCTVSFKPPNTLCLVVWRLVGDDDDDPTRLSNSCRWYLQHANPDIQVAEHLHQPNILALTFHLFDQDVVFFYDANHVFQYCMSSKKLHRVADMPTGVDVATQELSQFTIACSPWATCWLERQ